MKRNPLVSAFLSFLTPGIGQVYNGQIKKGLTYYFGILAILILNRPLRFSQTFPSMVFFVGVLFMFFIYQIFDAFQVARKPLNFNLKSYNKWYVYFAMIVGSLFVVEIIIPYLYPFKFQVGIQSFKIPTPNMEPSIKVDDKIMVDFSFSPKDLQIGDIAAYTLGENVIYLSRVAGISGSHVEMSDDFLKINSQKNIPKFINKEQVNEMAVEKYEELFPNGKKVNIYRNEDRTTLDKQYLGFIELIVPKDSILVISDNRDQSMDSRFYGFIPLTSVKGKVTFTWWGSTFDRIGVKH